MEVDIYSTDLVAECIKPPSNQQSVWLEMLIILVYGC